ncbi:MAG: hypothetical protein AAGF11_11260 [Myxococcota bacterium]
MKRSALTPLVCSLSMAAALAACQGKTAPTQQASADKGAKAETKAKTPAAPEGPAAASADAKAPTDAKAPPAAPPAAPAALGSDRADPGWFRKTMFGDKGKALDTKRSQADDQGRFSSMIRFEVTDMTLEGCATHIEQMVGKAVTNLQRKDLPNGRIQLKGSTDRYTATFMCGTAEGKTIAYVSYAWT